MDNRPVWKTVLSVAVCLIAVIRLAITCSKSSRSSDYDNTFRNANALYEQNSYNAAGYRSVRDKSISNDLLYEDYDSISKMDSSQKEAMSVRKVQKDTLVPITVNSKINVEAGSFVQKNYDDSLKIAIKFPDNTTLFMHSYISKEDMVENLKAIKKKKGIENVDIIMDEPDSKFISYTYKSSGKKYNGCALLAREKDLFTSLEFENDKISKKDLQKKAAEYILQVAK